MSTTQSPAIATAKAPASGDKLLDAAVHVIRSKGYSAARVEDICAEAGLTKGAFFHHFASKEACAVAAAAHFAARTPTRYSTRRPTTRLADPRDRVLGYVDFRKAILQGDLPQFTCLLGTMAQEAYQTHPVIRAPATATSANMRPGSRPTCRRPRRSMRPAPSGRRRAPRCSRRPCSRAASSSPRPKRGPSRGRLPRPSCGAISRGYWQPPLARADEEPMP